MSEEVVELRKAPNIAGCEGNGYSVVVHGWEIPNMRCYEGEDHVEVILDNRFSYTFRKDVVRDAVHLAATAMAIGIGRAHMGADPKDRPVASKVN